MRSSSSATVTYIHQCYKDSFKCDNRRYGLFGVDETFLKEMTHVGVDMVISRAPQTVVLVSVPLKQEETKTSGLDHIQVTTSESFTVNLDFKIIGCAYAFGEHNHCSLTYILLLCSQP